MIRYALLFLFLTGLLVYSWRNWFRALCLLIMMVSVLERPDMPTSMLGITGLNPFNIGLAGIVVAWAASRGRQQLKWDAPRWFNLMLGLLVGIMFIGFLRLFLEPSNLVATGAGLNPTRYSTFGLVSEFFLNTFKWMVPGVLLFLGCRSKEQHQWAVLCLVGLYLILAVQTIRQVPLPLLLDGEALEQRAGRVLTRRVGYHRVELAGVFAGASWAMLAVRPLFSSALTRAGLLGMSGATTLALALTAGRVGYGAWCVIGLLLAGMRWRRLLLLGPVAVVLVLGFAPGVTGRLLQGISHDETGKALKGSEPDLYTVTAGRWVMWPYVLESIAEQPVLGYGREAMHRNGLAEEVFRGTGEFFGHPHNGYLQFALDNGLIGLMVVLGLYTTLLFRSAALFRRGDPPATAAGGMAFALLASFLIAAIGAQTFYPTELSLGVWCAIGLLMRVSLQESGVQAAPAVLPARKVARLANTRSVRWGVRRIVREAPPESDGRNSAKSPSINFRGPRARLSPAAGLRELRKWKARQTR